VTGNPDKDGCNALLVQEANPFKVTGVTLEPPTLDAAVETVATDHKYRIRFAPKKGVTATSGTVKVTITTDSPRQPTIVVPISVTVAAPGTPGRTGR